MTSVKAKENSLTFHWNVQKITRKDLIRDAYLLHNITYNNSTNSIVDFVPLRLAFYLVHCLDFQLLHSLAIF